MLKKYDQIIWDWNGTLIDDVWLCVDILNEILCKHGKLKVSITQYLEKFIHPVKHYYESLGFDFSEVSFSQVASDYNSAYDRKRLSCNLHFGAETALKALFNAGVKQSVLSAYQQSRLESAASLFKIDKYFEEIAGLLDCYAHGKIKRGHKLISDLNVDISDCLLIGDTVHDYEVATELGIDCILICNGHNSRERLESCRVPIMDSIEQLSQQLMAGINY